MYKDKVMENGDYFVIPKFVAMLPFDEAMMLGYLIDTEKVTKHIQINNEDYFQCNMQGFIDKMFIGASKKQMRLLLDKLVNRGLITTIAKNDKLQKNNYIKLNYAALDELEDAYKNR